MIQLPKIFFDPTPDRQFPQYPAPPTEDEIREQIGEDGLDCPLNDIVVSEKNKGNMDKLRSFAFGAFRSYDRNCSGMNFGIYCGPGQGKTTIVKKFCATVGLPLVAVQSDMLRTTWGLWESIKTTFHKEGIELVPQEDEYHFILPPCFIWFDEAHKLSSRLRTAGLMNAMEFNDAIMKTSDPSDKNSRVFTIDCSNVCWICASTDPGILYQKSEAFYSRFNEHIIWHPAESEETSLIVFRNMLAEGTHIPRAICHKIAFYCPNPRKACGFARNVTLQKAMFKLTWETAVEKAARDDGIDEFGMTQQQLTLLTHLGQSGPTAISRLTIPLKVRIEELESMILPSLMIADERTSRPILVAITHRGCAITEACLAELDKRNIKHRGLSITAEHMNN